MLSLDFSRLNAIYIIAKTLANIIAKTLAIFLYY